MPHMELKHYHSDGGVMQPAVKPMTYFYYATNGILAKALVLAERQAMRSGMSRDATTFSLDDPETDAARVVALPDVPDHLLKRLAAAYGDRLEIHDPEVASALPPAESEGDGGEPKKTEKQAVHRGGGNWFVTQGEATLSGPHSKVEAQEIAAR